MSTELLHTPEGRTSREPMTRQEAFDIVWQKFVVERTEPGIVPGTAGPTCKYLTEDGRRCAIGWLVSEELAQEMSHFNYRIGALFDYFPTLQTQMGRNVLFYSHLQKCHDEASQAPASDFHKSIEESLQALAWHQRLHVPEGEDNDT